MTPCRVLKLTACGVNTEVIATPCAIMNVKKTTRKIIISLNYAQKHMFQFTFN